MENRKTQFKDFHNSYDEFVYSSNEYVENFTRANTMVDLGIQTKKRWKNKHEKEVIESLVDGTMTAQFHVVDIDKCISWAEENDNLLDVIYFKDLKNKGYKYLSIDGNHRTQLLWGYHNLSDFWRSKFRVILYKNLTTKEIGELAKRLNKGVAWNPIELRNSKSKTSDYIRKISGEFINLLNKFAGSDTKELIRFKEQETLESFLILYYQFIKKEKFNTKNKYKEIIRETDIHDSLLSNNKLTISIFNSFFTNHLENYKRCNYQMFYVMLYLLSVDFLETKRKLPTQEDIKDIVSKFDVIYNEINEDSNLILKGGLFDLTVRKSWDKLNDRFEYFKNNM